MRDIRNPVYQQAKDIAELVVSPTDNPPSDHCSVPSIPPHLLLVNTIADNIDTIDGSVIFDPCGRFQEFVLRVEDAVLAHGALAAMYRWGRAFEI